MEVIPLYLYCNYAKQYNEIMRLTELALNTVRRNVRCKNLLALELNVSVFTIGRYLDANSDNLTKAAALKVIRDETGLKDSEILEAGESLVSATK